MAGNYIQPGEVVEHTATANLASGQVVAMGNILGVALKDIPSGSPGPVQITGVFVVPKVAGAVIAQGESLTWDASAAAFDDNLATPASGDITGAAATAFEDAGNGATSLKVKLSGAPGTRTA